MGYDMHIVQEADQAELAAVAAAEAHIATLTRPLDAGEGQQEAAARAWDDAFEVLYKARRSYFRFNTRGMSYYRRCMDDLGMLSHEPEGDTDAEPQPVLGIPRHKFSSNDGWLVTPAQIAAALDIYRSRTAEEVAAVMEPKDRDIWGKWIDFLDYAKDRGGFRVW
jgi:hypothetical protein